MNKKTKKYKECAACVVCVFLSKMCKEVKVSMHLKGVPPGSPFILLLGSIKFSFIGPEFMRSSLPLERLRL